jgi:hypothetical protein
MMVKIIIKPRIGLKALVGFDAVRMVRDAHV